MLDDSSNIKYLGYDIILNYGDYDTYKVIIENLDEIESICKNIETDDEYFNVEYKEKYIFNDKILCSEPKYKHIENKSIPKKYRLIQNIYNMIESIYNQQDFDRDNVELCIKDLKTLLNEIE